MWGASVLPALVASAVVSGLFLAFFVLEHCVNAQCPYKKKGPTPSVPLPRVNTEVLMQLAREAVWEEPWESLAANSFLCIAKSQMACLATITFAWCTAACALLLLLSVLCPNPRPEEVVAFRNSSVFSFLQQAVMLTYLAGVEGCFQVSSLLPCGACMASSYTYQSFVCPGRNIVPAILVLQVLLQTAPIRATTSERSHSKGPSGQHKRASDTLLSIQLWRSLELCCQCCLVECPPMDVANRVF